MTLNRAANPQPCRQKIYQVPLAPKKKITVWDRAADEKTLVLHASSHHQRIKMYSPA